jgi:hypothetical protein
MSAAMSLIASLGDDADEDANDQALLLDTLEGETDVLEIAKRLVRAALDAEAMAEAVERRIHDLNARAARFAARANSARETVKQMLDALGVHRLTAEDFTVSLRMGPGKPLVTDPELLEDEFVRVSRSPNLTAIGKAQGEGRSVRGAARTNGSLILQVKTK